MEEDRQTGSSTTVGSRNASPEKSMSPVKSPRMEMETGEVAPPAKRARTATVDERARSKRMFGNILGTLRRFKDDDKSKRSSEAAKRREETSQRIAAKLAIESTLQNDIVETKRELRTLQLATENASYVLEHREIALTARHASLRVSARYLHTSVPDAEPLLDMKNALYPSAPLPLARPPGKIASSDAPPLYFLPKVLLPDQEDTLRDRQEDIEKMIAQESEDLRAAKDAQADTAADSADKIADLTAKLQRLQEQQVAARGGRAAASAGRDVAQSPERPRKMSQSGGREREFDSESRHDHDEDMEVAY